MTKYLFKCLNVIVKVGEWAMVNREKEAGLTMQLWQTDPCVRGFNPQNNDLFQILQLLSQKANKNRIRYVRYYIVTDFSYKESDMQKICNKTDSLTYGRVQKNKKT